MRRNGFRCAPGRSGAGHLRPALQVEAAEAAVQPQQQEQQRQQQQEWFDVMEEIAVGGESDYSRMCLLRCPSLSRGSRASASGQSRAEPG